MARIKGVDIPDNKRIEIALTYIYGIGKSLSKKVLNAAKIDVNKRAKDLSNEELNAIREQLDNYTIEGDRNIYRSPFFKIKEITVNGRQLFGKEVRRTQFAAYKEREGTSQSLEETNGCISPQIISCRRQS